MNKKAESFDQLSGHEAAFHNRILTLPYDYDPTNDGPESEVIGLIRSSQEQILFLRRERFETFLRRFKQ